MLVNVYQNEEGEIKLTLPQPPENDVNTGAANWTFLGAGRLELGEVHEGVFLPREDEPVRDGPE